MGREVCEQKHCLLGKRQGGLEQTLPEFHFTVILREIILKIYSHHRE